MRAPPAIEYPVSSHGLWRRGLAALSSVVVVVDALWALNWAGAGQTFAFGCALLAGLASAVIIWRLLPECAGTLRWDGVQWRITSYGSNDDRSDRLGSHLDLMLDLEDWMLLRMRLGSGQSGGTVWLPVARRAAPHRWPALRMTVWMAPRDSASRLVRTDGGAR
jgi:hypothetical protein